MSVGVGEDWARAAGETRHNAQYDVLKPAEKHLSGLGYHYVDTSILGQRTTNLFISEYLESDVGYDKAIELFNPSEYKYIDLLLLQSHHWRTQHHQLQHRNGAF